MKLDNNIVKMNISHVSRVRLLYKTILRLHRGEVNIEPFGNWVVLIFHSTQNRFTCRSATIRQRICSWWIQAAQKMQRNWNEFIYDRMDQLRSAIVAAARFGLQGKASSDSRKSFKRRRFGQIQRKSNYSIVRAHEGCHGGGARSKCVQWENECRNWTHNN